MVGRLEGKVALISGGARGLGAAHVQLFVEHGASVVFGDVRHEQGRQREESLRSTGHAVRYVELDVTDAQAWDDAVGVAVEEYGALTTLVNNAGIFTGDGLLSTTPETWSRVLDVNLTGQWLGMRAAMPALLEAGVARGASVVNVCSIYGNVGSNSSAAYHASKGGVRLLTKAAAVEYSAERIRINSVHPGMIETEFAGPDFATPESLADQLGNVPMGRSAPPREIAYASLFLASDEASYITGAELLVDGGWTVP
jgi:NAD(P)-dependent dehydrogenase (short-subunit alcohol dehydrogenase family)